MYKLKENFTRNPLKSGKLRNLPCICGSGKKMKKCCGNVEYIKNDKKILVGLESIKKAVKEVK